MVGPGLASFLIRALSAPLALLVDALGFVVAGFSVRSIRRPEPSAAVADDGPTMAEQVAEGLRYVARHHLLRWTAVFIGAMNTVGAALNVVLVLFEARVLHFSAGTIGLVFLLGNLGFVVGAPLVRGVTARLGIGGTRCPPRPWNCAPTPWCSCVPTPSEPATPVAQSRWFLGITHPPRPGCILPTGG